MVRGKGGIETDGSSLGGFLEERVTFSKKATRGGERQLTIKKRILSGMME